MHKKWHVFIAKIIIGENRLRFVVVFNFHGAWYPPYTRHSRASLTGKQYILCSCYPPQLKPLVLCTQSDVMMVLYMEQI